MKLSSRTKKILLMLGVVVVAFALTGCTVPRDANNNVIYIWNEAIDGYTVRTSFSEVLAEENWFSAIFVYPLAALINFLAGKISVGGAIAVVTILVQGVLAVATLKSTIASQQMQMIQPELERIQRKYEGRNDERSKQRQAAEMQKLYKEYDINPAGTMIITLIQLPIIMAMFMSVQRSWAVQSGTFFGMNLQTTTLDGCKQLLDGNMGGLGYLILFIVMGVCQFLSMKAPMYLQKQRAMAEAEKHHKRYEAPKSQTGMQIYMMGMILVFGFMFPAAMCLYWAINSIVNLIKTLAVQKVIDKRNEQKGARA